MDVACWEAEPLKRKIQPELSLTLSGSVSQRNVSTPPSHSRGSLTPFPPRDSAHYLLLFILQQQGSTTRTRWVMRSATAMTPGPQREREIWSHPQLQHREEESLLPARFLDAKTDHRFLCINHSNVTVVRVTRQLRTCGATGSIPRCQLRLSGSCSCNMLVLTGPRDPRQQLLILKKKLEKNFNFFPHGKHSATL